MDAILVKAAGLLLMILAGYGMKRLGLFHVEDAKLLSRIIVHLTLPAALVTGFRTFRFDVSYLALIAIALASNLLMLAVGLWRGRGKAAPVRALYGLNICSYNIGCFVLPFVQSFLPAEALIGVKDMAQPAEALMDKNFTSAGPEHDIVDLLTLFDERHLSTLPIVDDDGIIEGLITRSTLVNTLSRQFILEEGRKDA